MYSRAISRVLCSDNKHSRFGQQQLWKKRLVCIQSYIRSYSCTLRYRHCKNNRSNTPRAERPTGVCWQSHSGHIPWILSHLIIIIWHLRDTRQWIRSHVLIPLATYSFPITSCRRACESWTWHVFFQMGCQHDPTCWWSATLIFNLRLWSSIRWHNRGSLNESMVHVAWRYFHRWRLLILRSDKLFVGTKFLGKKNYVATDRLVAAACLACSGSLSLSPPLQSISVRAFKSRLHRTRSKSKLNSAQNHQITGDHQSASWGEDWSKKWKFGIKTQPQSELYDPV